MMIGRYQASGSSRSPMSGMLSTSREALIIRSDRREGHGRGARRGDREPSRMGGSGRPRRNGCRAGEHGRVRPVEPCVGGLQPLSLLHAANAAHAGHRGVARGQAPCWKPSTSCAATPRRGRPASCGRIRSGAGCCAPNPITACGRRRCCSTCATRSAPATSGWRGRAATAISERRPRRRRCRPQPAGPGQSARLAGRAQVCAGRRSAQAGRRGASRCDRGRQHRQRHPPHARLDHGPRHAPPHPGRIEQGRGAPCPQARHQFPPPRRTARPNRGGTALPGRRPQLAGRDHHLLEHAEARRGRLHQEERRPRRPSRIPGPRLAARMGTHQPDRRVPVARCRPTFKREDPYRRISPPPANNPVSGRLRRRRSPGARSESGS